MILPSHVELPPDEQGAPDENSEMEALNGLRKAIVWAWEASPKKVWPRLHDLLERELLKIALERFDGNQTRAAEWLGMSRGTVIKRIDEHGLKGED